MPHVPDLSDPRYLDEVGWFLYHEKHRRGEFGGPYGAERLAYSRLLVVEVAEFLGWDAASLRDRTVVSIGSGCTGDLAAFPSAVKIAVDPLLYTYQQLGLLVDDEAGAPTVYLSQAAEDLPLLDETADVVLCRNALDHMPDPAVALREMWRILRVDGALFVSVDIGGEPTPDEPTVFSVESLRALVGERFEVARFVESTPAHSGGRRSRVRLTARRRPLPTARLDRDAILRAYESKLPGAR
jgi:SAM-dependent methyltransferase